MLIVIRHLPWGTEETEGSVPNGLDSESYQFNRGLEEEWTVSHDALCFKLIYRKFWWRHHLILLFAPRGLMASFNTIPGDSASALQNCHMLYVHCISKENFIARPRDLSFMELVCREVHVSFLDKMAERRVALFPTSNGRHNVDILFVCLLWSGSCYCLFKYQQLTAHIDELRVFMVDSKIDILAINKSQLDNTIYDHEVCLPGFEIVFTRGVYLRAAFHLVNRVCKSEPWLKSLENEYLNALVAWKMLDPKLIYRRRKCNNWTQA